MSRDEKEAMHSCQISGLFTYKSSYGLGRIAGPSRGMIQVLMCWIRFLQLWFTSLPQLVMFCVSSHIPGRTRKTFWKELKEQGHEHRRNQSQKRVTWSEQDKTLKKSSMEDSRQQCPLFIPTILYLSPLQVPNICVSLLRASLRKLFQNRNIQRNKN